MFNDNHYLFASLPQRTLSFILAAAISFTSLTSVLIFLINFLIV